MSASDSLSLAGLVDRLIVYLDGRRGAPVPDNRHEIPEVLVEVYDLFGHHLAVLVLIAKSDNKIVAAERETIHRHCVGRIQGAGLMLSEADEKVLANHIRDFHPVEIQIGSTLTRLRQDSKADIAALIEAAHAVVEADGVVRLQEAIFLKTLLHDLKVLTTDLS